MDRAKSSCQKFVKCSSASTLICGWLKLTQGNMGGWHLRCKLKHIFFGAFKIKVIELYLVLGSIGSICLC